MFSFSLKFLQELWSMLLGYDEEGGFPEAGNISLISLFSLGTVRICILLILLLLYNRGRIKSKALSESFYKKKKDIEMWSVCYIWFIVQGWFEFFCPTVLGIRCSHLSSQNHRSVMWQILWCVIEDCVWQYRIPCSSST